MSAPRSCRLASCLVAAGVLVAAVPLPPAALASTRRAALHRVLPPARTASVAEECSVTFNPATLQPLFCGDGRLNAAAWSWIANRHRHRHGWSDSTLAVGRGASLSAVRSAVCNDVRHDGMPVAVAAEQVAAVYYDWSFLDSPLFGISHCSPKTVPVRPPPSQSAAKSGTASGAPIEGVPLPSAGRSAMVLVQRFADDLVQHSWSAARAIEPGLPSDAVLSAGYAGLDASTVVVTREAGNRTDVVLSGAYVAWEDVGGPRTSIYCTRWTVNLPTTRILGATAIGSDLVDYASGWVSASSLTRVVAGQCTP